MIPDPERIAQILQDVAETVVLPRFKRLAAHEISEKKPGDIVTIADEEAEEALEQALKGELPEAFIVGEEAASRAPQSMDVLMGDDPVWVIDPIDGTQNFADGKTCFAMIVALVRGSETLGGWIHLPIENATIWACRGEGAYEAGNRLRPETPPDFGQFCGSLTRRSRERFQRLRERPGNEGKIPEKIVRYRCVGAEYADLARGKLQFSRYGGRLKPWDHAAGVLIHAECGGFNAIVETDEPYRPLPTINRKILMMTPDQDAWVQIRDLLED